METTPQYVSKNSRVAIYITVLLSPETQFTKILCQFQTLGLTEAGGAGSGHPHALPWAVNCGAGTPSTHTSSQRLGVTEYHLSPSDH